MFPQHSSLMFRLKLCMCGYRFFFRGKGGGFRRMNLNDCEGEGGAKDEYVCKEEGSVKDNFTEFTI